MAKKPKPPQPPPFLMSDQAWQHLVVQTHELLEAEQSDWINEQIYLPEGERSKLLTMSVKMDERVVKLLDELAHELRVTRSDIVRVLVTSDLQRWLDVDPQMVLFEEGDQ